MKLLPLIDKSLVAPMARDLVRYDAAGSETDAIRSLMNRGRYSPLEIAYLAGEARELALKTERGER